MTPLGASLIFVSISILVSLFRHLFFHTSSINGNDDSNISLQKLHTITITQASLHKQPYNSLYEAYFKPQIPKQVNSPLPYSSFAFKKAILNNEGVYLCQQKFAAIFEERTLCENNNKSCKWKTLITVYRLPFLKKEESQTLEVDGRILSDEKFDNRLFCRPRPNKWDSFELNFVMILNSKDSKKGAGWTMHSLNIQEERQTWRSQGIFQLKLLKWNLKNISHYPDLYSFDQKCLSYVTKEEPWLIHYNCASQWKNFNILSPEVQKTIFSSNNSKSNPPFQPSHHVSPIFLKHFRSVQKIYFRPDGCEGLCPRQELIQQRNFITYVFQITNSPLRFGKTFAQITLSINNDAKNAKFVSFNTIVSNLNPEKQAEIDCNLLSKEYRLIKGLYTYQLGPHEESVAASFFKHSLLCVCSLSYSEELKIVEVSDLIGNFNFTDTPHELILRSKDALELRKLQYMFYRKQALIRRKEEPKEETGWFDFDIFNFKYNVEQASENELDFTLDSDVDAEERGGELDEADKKEKKAKIKKKEQKKRSKKGRKGKADGKEVKFPEDAIGEKLEDLHDSFAEIGQNEPFEAQSKTILIPMPLLPTTSSKLRIISGDPEYPLIYMETSKKYLLTYQIKEDEEGKPDNQTQRPTYTYKYAQIGSDMKSPELHVNLDMNDSLKLKHREQELELDRFLLEVLHHNGNIMNSIKSINVVEARYDEGSRQFGLKGFMKPHCRQVIVAWGWGLEVYEINWDRKGLKSQIVQIEQHLNSKQEGIQMATLIPFIELFATVYCLFQALITSR